MTTSDNSEKSWWTSVTNSKHKLNRIYDTERGRAKCVAIENTSNPKIKFVKFELI